MTKALSVKKASVKARALAEKLSPSYLRSALRQQGRECTPENEALKRAEILEARAYKALMNSMTDAERKAHKSARSRELYANDPERHREYTRRSDEKREAQIKARYRYNKENITDKYVASVLKKSMASCTTEELSAKRAQLIQWRGRYALAQQRTPNERAAAYRERMKAEQPELWKARQSAAGKKWYANNPEKVTYYQQRREERERTDPAAKAKRDESHSRTKEKHGAKYRQQAKDLVQDCHVAVRLGLSVKDCPPELIKLKRLHLKLSRKLKELNEKRI